jgi:PylC-like, N-terminal domain
VARPEIRALITGAGTGSSGNLIRALRAVTPPPYLVGVNDDRFTLKQSLADRNYLCPRCAASEFIDEILQIVRREQLNLVLPTDDEAVKTLSDQRERFPFSLLLPRRTTIDLCQDKYALTVFLRQRAIPAPLTYEVRTLKDLDRIFSRFSRKGLLWCRARHGSRSLAAIPVGSVEQARAWITLWRDLRGVNVSDFTLSEYLPGRHLVVQSIWRDGRLVLAQSVEVLSHFAAGNNPSGVFSLPSLAKTVVAPEALKVTLRALQAIDESPSGAFLVELREAANGVPCITEINAGRFPSGISALLAVGKHNMIMLFALSAVGEPVVVDDPYGSSTDDYLVRDIDTIPGVFTATDLLEGIHRAPLSGSTGTEVY